MDDAGCTLPPDFVAAAAADPAVAPLFGDAAPRAPIQVIYGGAQRFAAGTCAKLGELACRALQHHAAAADTFAEVFSLSPGVAATTLGRVQEKLQAAPVEDVRIDFEDGLGEVPDAVEDACARAAAQALGAAWRSAVPPPRSGLRIKALAPATQARAWRTLDLFVSQLVRQQGGLPEAFVVTLPKVRGPREVARLALGLQLLERALGLPAHTLGLELMLECPEAFLDAEGRCPLGRFVEAADGRCRGVSLGAFDYTAALGVDATAQGLAHPACDWARTLMCLALRHRAVHLSDGACNHIARDVPQGGSAAMHAAWRQQARHIRQALRQGIYGGWDLHPTQLVSRYAVVFGHYLTALPENLARLEQFLRRAAQATLTGSTFDDAASAQGLLNFFAQGLRCGALREADLTPLGVPPSSLLSRSFAQLVAAQKGPPPRAPPAPPP